MGFELKFYFKRKNKLYLKPAYNKEYIDKLKGCTNFYKKRDDYIQ